MAGAYNLRNTHDGPMAKPHHSDCHGNRARRAAACVTQAQSERD